MILFFAQNRGNPIFFFCVFPIEFLDCDWLFSDDCLDRYEKEWLTAVQWSVIVE